MKHLIPKKIGRFLVPIKNNFLIGTFRDIIGSI